MWASKIDDHIFSTVLRKAEFVVVYMSRLVGKPTICIGENKDADQLCGHREADQRLCFRYKDADQLRGNREADQRLCFRYSNSTIPLLHKSEISSF